VVLPSALRHSAIETAHAGHHGISRTYETLRGKFWWPKLHQKVETFVKNCHICVQHDKTWKAKIPPVQPISWPEQPWTKLGIDIRGPHLRLPGRYRYAIVLIDYHSRWPCVKFVPEVTTKVVCEFLHRTFCEEGLPSEIISDNGPQFRSNEFSQFLSKKGIKCR